MLEVLVVGPGTLSGLSGAGCGRWLVALQARRCWPVSLALGAGHNKYMSIFFFRWTSGECRCNLNAGQS